MDQTMNPNPAPSLPITGETGAVVDLTDAAVEEVKRLIQAQNLNNHHLRVGVQGGGCSGLMYSLHFDDEVGKYDRTFEVKGVKIVVDLKSSLYLNHTVIDHVQALTGGGFKFNNPNATRSCGCGTSFSA